MRIPFPLFDMSTGEKLLCPPICHDHAPQMTEKVLCRTPVSPMNYCVPYELKNVVSSKNA